MKILFWDVFPLAVCVFLFLLPAAAPISADQKSDLRINSVRLMQRIEKLAEFGGTAEGGVHRVAFSKEDIDSRIYLIELMEEAGLTVRIDEAGNIIGKRKGKEPGLPVIMSGSHSDTVPHGGKYDGASGVLSAIEAAQVLQENGIELNHPLEIVVFTDEEGGLMGSRAMTGSITAEALDEISHIGKTAREGVRDLGGKPEAIHKAARTRGSILAYIELHIEQGSSLDSSGIDIGIVEGIVGINRWDVHIEGFANHAGTTPMNARHDALLAAAHLIIAVNRVVTETEGLQVGTVGRIAAEPGAPNVIPGRVKMSLELRDLSAAKIQILFSLIESEAKDIAKKFGTPIIFDPVDATAVPAPTSPLIRRFIREAAEELNLSSQLMPSGAGHDAQDMALIAPTGMIFIPSIDGISHSPKESSSPEHLENGANVLLHTILRIDGAGGVDR